MNQRKKPNSYVVKRTRLGVRFSLRPREQAALKERVEDVANAPKPVVLEYVDELSNRLATLQAQNWLTKASWLLMPLNQEHRFTMNLADAHGLLYILWTDADLNYKPELQRIFTELHQMFS